VTVLAIDSATEVLSVAVSRERADRSDSPDLLVSTRDTGLHHGRSLMPLVDELLRAAGLVPADLDLIACTRGPGSFNGLRIGMATAKGLAASVAALRGSSAAPLVSVPTLAVMAYPHAASGVLVVPVIDGRKGRYYAAAFSGGERCMEDVDLSPAEILVRATALAARAAGTGENRTARIIVTGPHAPEFCDSLGKTDDLSCDPLPRRGHARALLHLAIEAYRNNGPDSPSQGPLYIRGSDAEISRGRKEQ
jgi:tRNA threonylcarbamoyladenosine biosynthesis protein TsaB